MSEASETIELPGPIGLRPRLGLTEALARADRGEAAAQRQRRDGARQALLDALWRAKLALGDTGLDEADLRDIDALTAIAARLADRAEARAPLA